MFFAGNNIYDFDINNCEKVVELFKECVSVIDKGYDLYRFDILDTSFNRYTAKEWLHNVNEKTIVLTKASVQTKEGEHVPLMSFEIAPGIRYYTGYKEKFHVAVEYDYKHREIGIRISTDLNLKCPNNTRHIRL